MGQRIYYKPVDPPTQEPKSQPDVRCASLAAAQQAEIRRYVDEVEPLLRRGASVELDGRLPVGVLADKLEELLGANRSVQKGSVQKGSVQKGRDGPAVT